MPLQMYPKAPIEEPTRIKHIIAVAAGKGGVGKSTVAVNLALALHAQGFSVGLMDTDIYGPSVRKMLPEDTPPRQNGNTIIPARCKGISMISMAYFRKEGEAAAVRAPIANGIINQFLTQVAWGALDFLIIDFPPGTGDVQLTLSQKANLSGAIIVTTPQEVALLDVRKAMHLFQQVQVPIIGIVENMSYFQPSVDQDKVYLFGRGGGEKLAQESGLPLLGTLPIDPLLSRCGDTGESIFSLKSSVAQNFAAIASNAIAQLQVINDKNQNTLTSFELVWNKGK